MSKGMLDDIIKTFAEEHNEDKKKFPEIREIWKGYHPDDSDHHCLYFLVKYSKYNKAFETELRRLKEKISSKIKIKFATLYYDIPNGQDMGKRVYKLNKT